jgi:RecA/RadA recombinase
MSNFFANIAKSLDDEDLHVAADGTSSGEFTGFIDSGSYAFNAAASGDIFGGIPNNKAIVIQGETTTGKSFFALGICKHWLDADPTAGVMYYDTEAAISKKMMADRGLDVDRVLIGEPITIQQFKHKAVVFVDKFLQTPEAERPPLMLVLDSLGQLSTSKEVEDTTAGNDTKDMTRAAQIKAAFRVLRLKLAKARIPMIVTNHTYATMDKYNPQTGGGGSGPKYAADTILNLSKRKEYDPDEDKAVIGNVVHVKVEKSRLSKENKKVDVLITYDKGLDRYYGMLELAERYGVFKKVSTRYELPDGSKQFGKAIKADSPRFFTQEVLDQINEGVMQDFQYGKPKDTSAEEIQEMEADA